MCLVHGNLSSQHWDDVLCRRHADPVHGVLARPRRRKKAATSDCGAIPIRACPLMGAQRSRAGAANLHQRVLCVECVIVGVEQARDDNLRDTRILTNPTVE